MHTHTHTHTHMASPEKQQEQTKKTKWVLATTKQKLPICMARAKINKLGQNPHIFGMVCYGRTLGLGECAPPTIVAVGDFFRPLLSSIIERKATTDTF